jgi:exonuclease III
MKVYSWNVCLFNKRIDEMADYIRALDFDVLCLQEVPLTLLERLQEMPFEMAQVIEVVRLERGNTRVPVYQAIVCKQPILNQGTLSFEELG